jgi:hypothetical protein
MWKKYRYVITWRKWHKLIHVEKISLRNHLAEMAFSAEKGGVQSHADTGSDWKLL